VGVFDDAGQVLADAAGRSDRVAAWDAAGRVVSCISDPAIAIDANALFTLVWKGAVSHRWFDIAEIVSGAAAARTDAALGTRRLHAQMLMERGFTEEALSRLATILQNPALSDFDREQVYGHVGRIYKDRFVAAVTAGDEPAVRSHLKQALEGGYWAGYKQLKQSIWLGINAVALLARPEAPAVVPGAAAEAVRIAQEILEDTSKRPDQYLDATLAEVYLALGKLDVALERVKVYAASDAVTGFMLNNLYRQLKQIWRLDTKPSPGPEILAIVGAALLGKQDGVLHLSSGDVQRARGVNYEAVFGADRFESMENYRRGLERCSCVARIGRSVEVGVGTGFVLPGHALSDKLDERFVLMTNAHVISENDAERAGGALHPSEAVVTFAALEGVAPDKEFGVSRILCSSPREQLDMVIVELSEPVTPKVAYPLAPVLPVRGSEAQVHVIGHPSGRGLSLSVNQLLDYEAPKVHYRTATEGGSSGSPVFNQDWKLIGIHHAGGDAVPMLNGKTGTYQANEGIWIKAISDAVQGMIKK